MIYSLQSIYIYIYISFLSYVYLNHLLLLLQDFLHILSVLSLPNCKWNPKYSGRKGKSEIIISRIEVERTTWRRRREKKRCSSRRRETFFFFKNWVIFQFQHLQCKILSLSPSLPLSLSLSFSHSLTLSFCHCLILSLSHSLTLLFLFFPISLSNMFIPIHRTLWMGLLLLPSLL